MSKLSNVGVLQPNAKLWEIINQILQEKYQGVLVHGPAKNFLDYGRLVLDQNMDLHILDVDRQQSNLATNLTWLLTANEAPLLIWTIFPKEMQKIATLTNQKVVVFDSFGSVLNRKKFMNALDSLSE